MPFLSAAVLHGFAAYQFGLKSEEDQHSDLMLRIVALFSVYFWLYIIFKEWKDSPSWSKRLLKKLKFIFFEDSEDPFSSLKDRFTDYVKNRSIPTTLRMLAKFNVPSWLHVLEVSTRIFVIYLIFFHVPSLIRNKYFV
ncbi:hypothetical protein Patl1_27539 [Pistacia atlantica]|uniref:Uncharacterized protein n=1 Tax=Pistacia atlantica TaxID=434234 RepID=A0ACC1BC33_9ROSI|nr:hypothetical protein Patl1_27539 [Pistacia atlantica]